MGNLLTFFKNSIGGSHNNNNNNPLSIVICLSVFSYIGEMTRVVTGQLFGLACHSEPGTVGWDQADWTPCTTAPGTTESTGGALFTDLPANMIGCFFMGLMISGDATTLGLPAVDMPMAFLPRHCVFQKWTLTHLGLRTGFCGALTTFASWNTQMVVMICGSSKATELGTTQWVSALFGYIIGLMVAMKAYTVGRDVAIMIHRRTNPDLAKEADVLALKIMKHHLHSITTTTRPEIAYWRIHGDLPDFERRFLYDIVIEDEQEELKIEETTNNKEDQGQRRRKKWRQDSNNETSSDSNNIVVSSEDDPEGPPPDAAAEDEDPIHHLQQWKDQTDSHRNGRVVLGESSSYTEALAEIESNILVEDIEPREELLEVARDAGWNVDALRNWKQATDDSKHPPMSQSISNDDNSFIVTEFLLYTISLLAMTALLLWGCIAMDGTDPASLTYRHSLISALVAPYGTILRWRLSTLNGKIGAKHRKWEWLPLGTFLANMIASVISALMEGLSLYLNSDQHNALVIVDSIQTGFTGSLSTVSTFAAEVTALRRALPRHAWSYYYSLGSLVLACILGVCAYVWAVV